MVFVTAVVVAVVFLFLLRVTRCGLGSGAGSPGAIIFNCTSPSAYCIISYFLPSSPVKIDPGLGTFNNFS